MRQFGFTSVEKSSRLSARGGLRGSNPSRYDADGSVTVENCFRRKAALGERPKGFVGLVAVALFLVTFASCGDTEALPQHYRAHVSSIPSESKSGLVFSATTIDLGYVAPGGRSEEIVLLTNESGTALAVGKVVGSCECLRVTSEEKEIAPSGKLPVRVTLDLSDDMGFVGSLSMRIEALCPSGTRLASTNVTATVDSVAEMVQWR